MRGKVAKAIRKIIPLYQPLGTAYEDNYRRFKKTWRLLNAKQKQAMHVMAKGEAHYCYANDNDPGRQI